MISRPFIARLSPQTHTQRCLNYSTQCPALSTRTSLKPLPTPILRCTYHKSQSRPFRSTRIHRDSNFKNHYEVLRMPPTATKAELKKQFYALSKETHPDRHPDDPTAGERFSQISESYSILADDEKRRRYDRDFHRVQRTSGGGGQGGAPARSGSYAGGRAATGLSKRRGTFRGPPPSFYAQGGYGSSPNGPSQTAGQGQQQPGNGNGGGAGEPYTAGTFNSQAFTDRANTEYDPRTTYRTQTVEDQRRMQRKAAEFRAMQAEIHALADSDFWARFVVVATVITFGVVVGSIVVSMSNSPRGGYTRGDGSKRGEKRNDWAKG